MKTTKYHITILILFAVVLLGAVSPLVAQTTGGSIASVTLALKRSHTIPGTVEHDENGNTVKNGQKRFSNPYYELYNPKTKRWKIGEEFWMSDVKTEKYSNREFLLDLVQLGVLPEKGKAPFIAGWSIVEVNATIDMFTFVAPQYYARHKDGEVVELGGIFYMVSGMGLEYGANKEKSMYKRLFKIDAVLEDGSYSGEELSFQTLMDMSSKSPAQVYLDFQSITGSEGNLDYAELHCTHSGGWKKSGGVRLHQAGKYTGISGNGFSVIYSSGEAGVEPYEVSSVFEGSILTGRGSKTDDVSIFPGLVP